MQGALGVCKNALENCSQITEIKAKLALSYLLLAFLMVLSHDVTR
jgi:hypothetical protein